MARLAKGELLNLVVQAVRDGGDQVFLLSSEHPYDLLLISDQDHVGVRLYIWNITHGGATRSESEYRIQITGVPVPLAAPAGSSAALLGWDAERRVFVAFDARRHREPGSSPSVQISLETLIAAHDTQGIVSQRRSPDEVAFAFPPPLLATYLQQHEAMHALASRPLDVASLERASTAPPREEMQTQAAGRETLLRMVAQKSRSADFVTRVLTAYDQTCAICDVQLGLVDAAHIVPVAVDGSTDETANGMALCALHHRAYDSSLVGVSPAYDVLINESRVEALHALSRAGGLERFQRGLRTVLRAPVEVPDRPKPDYLERGLRVRGWEGS